MDESKVKYSNFRDNLEGLKSSLKYVKTIFGDVPENVVTFCFDTSGSMYRVFYHFREHLIEKLFQMYFAKKGQKFNVILFNSSIHQCYSKHVQLSYENIINAINWMNKPYYESKSHLLGGLLKSFEGDPDAVYLITDGFPSNDRLELLNHLPHITKGRPIKTIMITSTVPPDDTPLDFLEDIADITNGTISVIGVSNYGPVEVLMPVYYEARPMGIKRAAFSTQSQRNIDCLKGITADKTLQGDPMMDQLVVNPFVTEDPLSGKLCPFYHPYFHWYWPQYWHQNGPGPHCLWTKNDAQYHCMSANYRDSRAFISGKNYPGSYRDPVHCMPYAGMLLVNKRVLACNHNDNNNYYMGKVVSQVSQTLFLVKFDNENERDNVQKTEISEIIDIDEQKRHNINVDDYVLAPVSSEQEAYNIAIVLTGKESRMSLKSVVSIPNVQLTVRFLSDGTEKQIEPNKSIFLSKRLKLIVERCINRVKPSISQDSFEYEEQSPSLKENNLPNHSIKFQESGINNNNSCCIEEDIQSIKSMNPCSVCEDPKHCCCCVNRLHRCIDGRIASPVDNGQAITLEELKEQVKKRFGESKDVKKEQPEDNGSAESSDEEEEEKEEEIDRNVVMAESDSDDQFSQKHDRFTETDLNWCILRILNKHSKKQDQLNKNQRPPWKYWGHKSIPDVMDPPSSEPFDDPPFWGCLMPKPAVEWPSVSFQEVDPHRVTDCSPQKMYQIFKQQVHRPSHRPKRDASTGRDCIPSEESRKKLLERRFNYLQGGYPKLEIKNPYNDSVKPLLSSWSAVGSVRNRKSTSLNCLNSLEKSRIDSQIQRDESNILRYIETNKPQKSRQALVQFQ